MDVGVPPARYDSWDPEAEPSGTPVESLPLAQARAQQRLLAQYVLSCPRCGKIAAAHVDEAHGVPELVRFVCVDACEVADTAVLAALALNDPIESEAS